jgi:hypothetical protein
VSNIVSCPPDQYTQILASGDSAVLEFRGHVSIRTQTAAPSASDVGTLRFDHGETFTVASAADNYWCKPLGVFSVNVGVT